MIHFRIIACCLCLFSALSQVSFGQSIYDPATLSGADVVGTGRFAAMGGAFSSLGGDGSALGINPAGIGVFINSQIDGSLTSTSTQNSVLFQNRSNGSFSIPSINVVFANPIADSPWKGINFGLVTNRIKTYGEDLSYQRETPIGFQLVDFFLNQATGFTEEQVRQGEAGLFPQAAYETFIIDPDTNNSGTYTTKADGPSDQSISFSRLGELSDFEISVGGNYNNKFYFGANIGFSNFSVNETFGSTESYEAGSIETIAFFDETQREASAFTFKIGAIYRVIPNLRLSAYYHAPRSYKTIVNYRGSLEAEHTDTVGYRGVAFGPFDPYAYNMVTPHKLGFGAAYIFAKNLIFSLEGETTSLNKSRLTNSNSNLGIEAFEPFYSDISFDIRNNYVRTFTFRSGLEVRLNKLYLRGGYNWQSAPFTESFSSIPTSRETVTGGAGYQINNVMIDGYFSFSSVNQLFTPYTAAAVETNEVTQLNLGLGLTYKF